MTRRILIALASLALLASCTCSPGGSPPPRAPTATGEEPAASDVAGGLQWEAGAPFVSRRATSTMRAAEYGVEGRERAELAVFYFGRDEGGTVEENVGRWLEQLTQPDGRPTREVARVETTERADMEVTLLDASGTFSGMRGSGPSEPQPGHRVLGAIVRGPEGLVFFKLTGPEADVEFARPGWGALVDSIRPVR